MTWPWSGSIPIHSESINVRLALFASDILSYLLYMVLSRNLSLVSSFGKQTEVLPNPADSSKYVQAYALIKAV